MIDTIAAFDGRLAKIEGAARSGKTQALVARCAPATMATPAILLAFILHPFSHLRYEVGYLARSASRGFQRALYLVFRARRR